MATQTLVTQFRIRRGTEEAWERINPILASGEPGYVIGKNLLKIGDGETPWNQLKYLNGIIETSGGVYNAQTHYDFPSVGSSDIIYKAEAEKKIYQWDSKNLRYDLLSEIETTWQNLEIIHGGNANGAT